MCECWTANLLKLEHVLVRIFAGWGRIVAKYPLIVIIVSLAFAVTMALFISNMETETETRNLFAAEDTISWNGAEKYLSTWGVYDPDLRYNNLIIRASDDNENKNIFNTKNLRQALTIHNHILNISLKYGEDGNFYTFNDFCSKIYSNNENCNIECVLEFFSFNETLIDATIDNSNLGKTSDDINLNRIIEYPIQYSPWSQEDETLLVRTGSPTEFYNYNYTLIVNATPAFQCTYITDGDNWDESILVDFEDEFVELLDKIIDDLGFKNDLSVSFNAFKSFDDELTRSVASDIGTFVIAFVILSTFGSVLVLRFKTHQWCNDSCNFVIDAKRSRALVANFGVIAACLAVASCFGFAGGILGVKFNSVVSVSPFLLLGLGVDDMFVLLRSYELTSPNLSVEDRIATTMERGGVSILFTSITDLVAFGIGSTARFGAVSAFCSFCAVGVLFDFLFQITFFLGFMVFDSRWNSSINDDFEWTSCLCFCFTEKRTCGSCKNNKKINESVGDKSGVELATNNARNGQSFDATSGQTNKPQLAGRGRRVSASVSIIGHLIDDEASSKSMEKVGEWILKDRRISACIMLLFAGYVAGGIYGITTLTSYEDPVDLAPNDSYLRDFYDDSEDYFDEIGPALMFSFDKELDYSDKEVQYLISNFTKEIEEYKCFGFPGLTQSWIASYTSYLDLNNITVNDITDWYSILYSEYLNTEEGSIFIDDIWETVILDSPSLTYDTTVNGLSYFEEYDNVTGITSHLIEITDYNEFSSTISNSIKRSRIWVQLISIGYGAEVLSTCLDFLHDIVKDYKKELGTYYYYESMQFAETGTVALEQTIINVSLASSAAFLICLILIPFPSVALYVSYAVAQILIGVLGYMALWDITINTTSMINIVISVGFSVDNTAHFCHAYMIAPIKPAHLKSGTKGSYLEDPSIANNPSILERHQRVLFALNSVGVPILAGDISTICALLPLTAAESAIFVSFFKILFLVMIFGAAHAILFLPIVFSVIGPINGSNDDSNSQDLKEPMKSSNNGENKNDNENDATVR